MPKCIKNSQVEVEQKRLGGVEAGNRKGWFREYSGNKEEKEKSQVKSYIHIRKDGP